MTEIELSKQKKIAEIKKASLVSVFTDSLDDSFYSFSVLSRGGSIFKPKEDSVEDSFRFSIKSKSLNKDLNEEFAFRISLDFDAKKIKDFCEKLKNEYFKTNKDFEDFILDSCLKKSLFLNYYMVESFYNKNPDGNIENFPLWDKISHFDDFVFKLKKFSKLTLPSSLISIGDNSFHKCRNLEEIELPDSVEKIGLSAFLGCTSLKKVHISKSLKTIKKGTFVNCESLTEIEIPDSVQEIEKTAFQGCRIENFEYKDFKIKNSLVFSDDNKILECCTNVDLERVELPDTVEVIKDYAFSDCINLKTA